MTNRETLLELFTEITEKAVNIMKGKNTDYATEEDALANFRSSEVLNVDARKALLIRMLDKIKRQVNFIERGTLSVDSAEDDIIDLINYSVLLHALNLEKDDTEQIRSGYSEVKYITREEATKQLKHQYKEGELVQVVDNTAGHGFEIGEKVTLQFLGEYGWSASNEDGVVFYVYEADIVPIRSTERSTGI